MRIRLVGLLAVATVATVGCASDPLLDVQDGPLLIRNYRAFSVEAARNDAGKPPPAGLLGGLTNALRETLGKRGIAVAGLGGAAPRASLRSSVISCIPSVSPSRGRSTGTGDECMVKVELFDGETKRRLVRFVTRVTGQGRQPGLVMARLAAGSIADELARLTRSATATESRDEKKPDRFTVKGVAFEHKGGGAFSAVSPSAGATTIDLKELRHGHDPAVDRDVPIFTNVTLNDGNGRFADPRGREFAVLTLYNIDPPLEDLASPEKGIDLGVDFRDPSNLVRGTYSNYVSPVFTDDRDRRPVAGHPIGHFYVKLQLPGYPTIVTGMTTTKRADEELANLTVGRQLGIGGVLMTPQPGRLNSAAEVMGELSLRQRRLIVIDGVRYKNVLGRNVGPKYRIDDGNVTFARFKIPVRNGKDALRFFLEYIRRDAHSIFGSLENRPHKGNGAGCSAFAMAWLKASGVIPLVDESRIADYLGAKTSADGRPAPPGPFWANFYRKIFIPWDHMGCDERLGVSQIQPVKYTLFDLLFYRVSDPEIVAASAGLARHIKKDIGELGATLFQFGAFTPLRNLLIDMKRKDPKDRGDYAWAKPGRGLPLGFWDNSLFSDWIKGVWRKNGNPKKFKTVREGRFVGVEIDAMDSPRQSARFFERADEIAEKLKRLKASGTAPTTCQALFALGVQ